MGDAVISAFFAADKPKAREKAPASKSRAGWRESLVSNGTSCAPAAASLEAGAHPLSPFHWEIEFPEVFARENSGFDAIVGNPPFAGKNTIIAEQSKSTSYLGCQTLHRRCAWQCRSCRAFFSSGFQANSQRRRFRPDCHQHYRSRRYSRDWV